TPSASLGHVFGSHFSLLKVETSFIFTRSINSPKNSFSQIMERAASSPRAAVRPNVENRASTGTPSLPSVAPTSSLTSAWPAAYETSRRESGPTSIALSFHRGVLRNEYFSYPARVSKGGCG